MTLPNITHVFVLMLENRSFDHMLGASGLPGIAVPPAGTSNSYKGVNYPFGNQAPAVMAVDPGHEFPDVVVQLAGNGASYPSGGPYPAINMSGFVADYASSPSSGEGNAPTADLGQIMQGFPASALPVLNTLAAEFAVCDHWFSSMPGPTWPNRFFVAAASSGGLDHSPSASDIITWETVSGFSFPNGTIFDKLGSNRWRLYADGSLTIFGGLKGIFPWSIDWYADFASDVASSSYPGGFTFIEPDYGNIVTFQGGTSQHPLDTVSGGELLIKQTYEAIRNSPHWNTSLLIVTYDEHGGFFDHVAPGPAPAPDDGSPKKYNEYGFDFKQYGVRVPAVIVSPLIPKGTVNSQVYDHSSVLATVEPLFGIKALTKRDETANNLLSLLSLSTPRTDTPTVLPDPAPTPKSGLRYVAPPPANSTVDAGNLPGFLHSAMVQHAALLPESQRKELLARVQAIRTKGDAAHYFMEAEPKLRLARSKDFVRP